MDTPCNEICYGIGRTLAAGGERRPVVQIYERQFARMGHNHVAPENIEARSGGSLVSDSLQVGKIERIFAGLSGIEPVKKSPARHSVKLYLVARPMCLQCRDFDPAVRESQAMPTSRRCAESIHCTSAVTEAWTSPRFSQMPPLRSRDRKSTRFARAD